MKWLITGGCGFVGSNLAHELLAGGHDVTVLDNLRRVGSDSNLAWLRAQHGQGWRSLHGDVRDAGLLEETVRDGKPDAVAHLAGQVAMTTSIEDPRLDFEINALGTFNVLEAVRKHAPAALVMYSSTNKVYGSLEQLRYEETATRYVLPDYPRGLGEDLPLDGHSPYGCSKLCGDQYVRDYHRIFGIPTVVFRHSSMYGRRQFATSDQGWIGWFCMKALEMADPRAPAFTICGDGKQVRDVLRVEELVRAYRMAAAAPSAVAGRIYNIGGGQANSLSLLELFALLERATGSRMRVAKLPWRTGDQKVFVADPASARRDFGWEAGTGVDAGLHEMLDWCREYARG